MSRTPKISVVIPCYNQAAYIEEAVNSVLNQKNVDNFEVIVVNDGSTDKETAKVLRTLKAPNLTVITTKNRGVSAARNTGIKRARGKYILPLDGDDYIGPNYLWKAAEILDQNPDIGIVYCNAKKFGLVNGKWKLPEYKEEEIIFRNCIFNAGMFRHKSWQLAGGYDETMDYCEDWNLWLSIIEQGLKPYKLKETLFFYRRHKGNKTHKNNTALSLKARDAVVRKFMTDLIVRHPALYIKYADKLAERLQMSNRWIDHLAEQKTSKKK